VRRRFAWVPDIERTLVRSGIQAIKCWFSLIDDEQRLSFRDACTTR